LERAGDVPLMVAEYTNMTFESSGSLELPLTVFEGRKGTSRKAGGTFTLELDEKVTGPISAKASEHEIKVALEQLDTPYTGPGSIAVTRSSNEDGYIDPNNVYKWDITFLDYRGDVPSLLLNVDRLSATGGYLSYISEVHKGSALGGTFGLSFDGVRVDSIPFDATASAVENAVQKLQFKSMSYALDRWTHGTDNVPGGYLEDSFEFGEYQSIDKVTEIECKHKCVDDFGPQCYGIWYKEGYIDDDCYVYKKGASSTNFASQYHKLVHRGAR